jgi:mRNA interferase RelE/StbE
MYDVRYASPAKRYFKKIKDKHLLSAFENAIDELKIDPYIGTKKTGDLSDYWGYDVKYASVNYELAYQIFEEDGKFIIVVLAGTRENFYDELKRLGR